MGVPDATLALQQHAAYCAALERNGCTVVVSPANESLPDSTFVEDTALILPGHGAMITRPGAVSRRDEVQVIHQALHSFFLTFEEITAPATLDAGDVCEAGDTVFVGLSQRTNLEGTRQLAEWLSAFGMRTRVIDIRHTPGILHLKSGVVALDADRLLAIEALADHEEFAAYDVLRTPVGEEYAANCVRVNDVVFAPDGFPQTQVLLADAGYDLELLDMSEFQKADGGLSCLSLRF